MRVLSTPFFGPYTAIPTGGRSSAVTSRDAARIAESARNLIARGRPLAEVAARTGLADQSHLTRWFVRYYGVTPGDYRRALTASR